MSKYTSRYATGEFALSQFATFAQSEQFVERFVHKLSLKRLWFYPLVDFIGLSKLMGAYLMAHEHKYSIKDFISPSLDIKEADILILKGPMTQKMYEEILPRFHSMPQKKWVIYIGPKKTITWSDSLEFDFENQSEIAVDIYIPGGRISSRALLEGIELLHERVAQGVCANA
ncbi:hypothetical protein M899_2341 [Bacteriovorax sp. BSW11_IV]|uniref:hypothetical protein n=1 Tax=Bacteriovorax sp. BSW11_IV TaxID=1353529 RepID=UPI00038A4A96|nr:hypothetical protein [Bacteriovorax sp. BSW11_IV]EQC44508.1 hypothetical protein M899_2341 [Bacteriovorax sp. BSW11_IV]